MVETAATFQSPISVEPLRRTYEDVLQDEDIKRAGSLREQDHLIKTRTGMVRVQEEVVFDAATDRTSFQAYQLEMAEELGAVRLERQQERDIQRQARLDRIRTIDRSGYSWTMLVNPPKP